MDFNLITKIENCQTLIGQAPLNLIYYSHIPTAILSLVVGFFVLFKSKFSLLGKLLFFISISFSLWVVCSLITWTSSNSILTMTAWSFFGTLTILIFLLCLYFIYIFAGKTVFPLYLKLVSVFFLIPAILATPTALNLTSFDSTNCEATEGKLFLNYYYIVSIIIFFGSEIWA